MRIWSGARRTGHMYGVSSGTGIEAGELNLAYIDWHPARGTYLRSAFVCLDLAVPWGVHQTPPLMAPGKAILRARYDCSNSEGIVTLPPSAVRAELCRASTGQGGNRAFGGAGEIYSWILPAVSVGMCSCTASVAPEAR